MADESAKTPIQNKYAQQYADDLAANRQEQGDVTAQIADLQKRLKQLKAEEDWLANAQGSLPEVPAQSEPEAESVGAEAEVPLADTAEQTETSVPAEKVTDAPQAVPQQRQDQSVREKPRQAAKKTARAKKSASKKTAAKKPSAKKSPAPSAAAAAEAPAEAEERTGPPLWQLALNILLKTPGQPYVAKEVCDQLAQDHPDRATSIQTVRNTLETLVKKNLAEKSRQQGSVMYTADEDAAPAADGSADGEGEQAPEAAAETVPAEV